MLLAAVSIFRQKLRMKANLIDELAKPLRYLHSGHVGDYVAWLTFGVLCFGALFGFLVRRSQSSLTLVVAPLIRSCIDRIGPLP